MSAKALILRPKPGNSKPIKSVEKGPVFVSSNRTKETCPLVLENHPDADYALLDSGNGQKLERYGRITLVRPEAQAFWQPQLPETDWQNVDALFTGDTNEEGAGRWSFPKKKLPDTWPMSWDGIRYHGRFTAFRHVGVFPEQAAHWRFMEEAVRARVNQGGEFRVLNLFGYTGLASLVAARAGAQVTHVDASKKAIGWARENQDMADLTDKPIRWICEDAVRFCEREERRGNIYDGILLDPPAYGRGPKGEVWQLFENLPHMLDLVRALTNERSSFVVLTAYAIRASFFAMHEIMQEKFGDAGGTLESGELVLKTENSDRKLSTSMFSRWVAE
ncbi:MAG: class I SAM-dependent methyltransferase [Rhizobiaceae bacterium]|nr:class I SAM-dependent methyltransferase [Rhizobiaceae bacterium]